MFSRLTSPALPAVAPDVALERLAALHPRRYSDMPLPRPDESVPAVQVVDGFTLLKLIKERVREDAAPGLDCWTQELLLAVARDGLAIQGLSLLIQAICNGALQDPHTRVALLGSRLVAVPKPDSNGVRPIAVGSALCKIASHYLLLPVTSFLRSHFAPHQLGLFVSGGVERALLAVQDSMDALGNDGFLISVDLTNAFNARSRHTVLSSFYDIPELAGLARLVHWTYGSRTPLFLFQDRVCHGKLWSEEGVRQGDVLGSLLFALSIQDGLRRAGAASPALVVAIHDDVTIVGRRNAVRRSFCTFVRNVCGLLHRPPGTPPSDVVLNHTKSFLFYPGGASSCVPRALARLGLRCQSGDALRLLGSFVAWDPADRSQATVCAVRAKLLTIGSVLNSPAVSAQLFVALVRMCVIPSFTFLARVTPPAVFLPSAALVDYVVQHLSAARLGMSELLWSESALKQIRLPLTRGGAGFTSLVDTSSACFLSSFVEQASGIPSVARFLSAVPAPAADAPVVPLPPDLPVAASAVLQSATLLRAAFDAYAQFWQVFRPIPTPAWLPGPHQFVKTLRSAVVDMPKQCQSELLRILNGGAFREVFLNPVPMPHAVTAAASAAVTALHKARLSIVSSIGGTMDWLAVLPRTRDLCLSDPNFCTVLRLRLGLPHCDLADDRCLFCGVELDHVGNPFHVLACPSSLCASAFRARHDRLKYCAADIGVLSSMSSRLELRYGCDRTKLKEDYVTDVMFEGAYSNFFIDVSFVTSCTPARVASVPLALPNDPQHFVKQREKLKTTKYRPLAVYLNRPCIPVVFDTLGCAGVAVQQFLKSLSRNLVLARSVPPSRARELTRAFASRLAITAQRAVFQVAYRASSLPAIDFGSFPACVPVLPALPALLALLVPPAL